MSVAASSSRPSPARSRRPASTCTVVRVEAARATTTELASELLARNGDLQRSAGNHSLCFNHLKKKVVVVIGSVDPGEDGAIPAMDSGLRLGTPAGGNGAL